MRAISIMYDSLRRDYLEAYGATDVITPNFKRLSEKCVTFDNFYAGSLPCMPARRELHTGRYNFLHRAWGPVEPFDDSCPEILARNGIHTHFISDHVHYWQEGGLNYHNRFSTYEFIRGQEGDAWKGDASCEGCYLDFKNQDKVNRKYMVREEDTSHVRTFQAGMEFLQENVDKDNWYMHLEYFDPHEPFYVPEKYKNMYTDNASDFDWPPYEQLNEENQKFLKDSIINYKALITMCDEYLGKILDFMDEHDMWKNTMLIVNTDHGYLLGEHGWYAKNRMPCYSEIAKLPFFLWNPNIKCEGERRNQLAQTIDIAPTLLDFFGIEKKKDMQGISLNRVLKNENIRDYALFGLFGMHVNVTDGKYVYMRSAREKEAPLYNYTLMPTNIFEPIPLMELRQMDRTLCEDFSFTKGVPVMKIPTKQKTAPGNCCYFYDEHIAYGDLLFDLKSDPGQTLNLKNSPMEEKYKKLLVRALRESDAPHEQYERLGLTEEDGR